MAEWIVPYLKQATRKAILNFVKLGFAYWLAHQSQHSLPALPLTPDQLSEFLTAIVFVVLHEGHVLALKKWPELGAVL